MNKANIKKFIKIFNERYKNASKCLTLKTSKFFNIILPYKGLIYRRPN